MKRCERRRGLIDASKVWRALPPSVRKEGMNGSDREELGGRKDGDIIDQSVIVALRYSGGEMYRRGIA